MIGAVGFRVDKFSLCAFWAPVWIVIEIVCAPLAPVVIFAGEKMGVGHSEGRPATPNVTSLANTPFEAVGTNVKVNVTEAPGSTVWLVEPEPPDTVKSTPATVRTTVAVAVV